ncbi:MAG: hypothetical protein Fur0025_22960 [Oscillatoriaceae cyanobacterium]
MQAVILIGIQGSGKSTFCQLRFFHTHIRINLDMLKTRHREEIIFRACVEAKQPFVIDNTNPTPEDRARYIPIAKQYQFRIIGYYFHCSLSECQQRNAQRTGKQKIPPAGILATHNKLVLPEFQEGFDDLYYVQIDADNSFVVREWDSYQDIILNQG